MLQQSFSLICFIVSACRVFAIVEPSLSSLESRIVELEKRDQLLIQIVQDQATSIRDLTASVKTLQDQNSEQANVIKDIQAELETIQRTVQQSHTEQPSEPHEQTNSNHEIKTFQKKGGDQRIPSSFIHSERARKFLLNGAETVAFHANFPDDAHVVHHAVGTPIAFSKVLLNVGGGYHPSTSLFIAPMSGIYIFSTSIMSSINPAAVGQSVHAGIVKNGTYLAGVYVNHINSAEQGSVTVATQLSIGDEVWVKHVVHNDGSIYGGGLTSFMGCLIMPL